MHRALIAAAFASLALVASAANPDALTPDGGRYYGPLLAGKLEGKGRLEWDNGAVYEGEFANGLFSGPGKFRFASGEVYEGDFRQGMFWGRGEVHYVDGRVYRGDFARNRFEGKGRLETAEGEVYEGDFTKDRFTGQGTYTRKDGSRYEGRFRDYRFDGPGRWDDGHGSVWEGTFSDGQLSGHGKSTSPMGSYEGEFKDWAFHGKGVLKLKNGDVYEGEFEHGMYHGQGTLTHAKARADGKTRESGTWRYGSLTDDARREQMLAGVERALYSQPQLLDKALAALEPRKPGRINLFLLTVAGDGSQEVFRREVDYVQKEFAERFGTAGHSVALVNSRNTVEVAPMATVTSIRAALKAIAARMNVEEDILFLFMTSHGSQERGFYLNQNGMQLPGLGTSTLARLLEESGIRWKVVVVSACYSGGFIEPLQDGRSLIIAAARKDRTSFGCADENDFTYFGRAYFKESLPKATSFREAFHKADALVSEWEKRDAAEGRSFPQISSSPEIERRLERWWKQSAPQP
jgi:hypothetical protein